MLTGHEEHHDFLRQALLESGTEPADQVDRLVFAHVDMHATYPLLARVSNRELAALSPESLEKVLTIRKQSEQFFVDVITRGSRLGVFTVADPWLATAAIGAMGIRVAEWWSEDLSYTVEEVASTYGRYALSILTERP